MSETQLQAERDFLLARQIGGDHTWVGVSSDEMVRAAMTGLPPRPFKHPYDAHDLRRCEETYRRAPEHLKPAMKRVLDGFRLMVSERAQWPNPRTAEQAAKQVKDAIERAATDA